MAEKIRLLQFPLGYMCLGTKGLGGQLKISECNDLLRVVFSDHGFALAAQSSAGTVSWGREC